jgi:hypothetical protein
VALVSAAVTVFGQIRIAKYQGKVAQAVEDQKFLQTQYADVGSYCIEQNAALREAYLDLFETEPGLDADGQAVGDLAATVDREVMRPLRKYEALVDEQTRNKIYEIHNLVAQLRGDPSADAINNFKSLRNDFYRLIEEARELLKPSGVLTRAGIRNH